MPRPCKLTFDLLTLKLVSDSRVTWATSMPILVFLGLSILDSSPMYATNRRQRDRQTSDSIIAVCPRLLGAGHNKCANNISTWNDRKKHNTITGTRRHGLKLAHSRCHCDLRKCSSCFTLWVVNLWNSLPEHVISADNINISKNRVNRYWSNQDYKSD